LKGSKLLRELPLVALYLIEASKHSDHRENQKQQDTNNEYE
jgi:hypothetical protein